MKDLLILFSIIGAMLLIASLIGFRLKQKYQHGVNQQIDNLNRRIKSWWFIVFVLILCFLAGQFTTTILFLVISVVSLYEFLTSTCFQLSSNKLYLGLIFSLSVIQYWLVIMDMTAIYVVFLPITVLFLLPFVTHFILKNTVLRIEDLATLRWGLFITVYCLSFIPALFNLNIANYEGKNLFLIIFFILVVQLSDVLQYIFGKLYGKHKIVPMLSPSKTVEGFIGGILSASVIGAFLYWITPFSFLTAGLISLLITVIGFLSGLTLSAIKRNYQIKDWGVLISGHGGVLDRVDSLCFSAPIFFILSSLS